MAAIQIHRDKDELVAAAAETFVQLAGESIAARGHFSVALAGGSTPRALHTLLATPELASKVDWSHVHLFWGDERSVPPEHDDSNFRMARETLIDHVPIPEENLHRMRGEIDAQDAASEYQAALEGTFSSLGSSDGSIDRLDLVFLGMGDDGHTLSLFPGTEALHETARPVVANHVEKLDTWRITMTAPFVNSARHVIFFVAGGNKADRLQEVLEGPKKVGELPSQIIDPKDGTLTWMVDQDAAAKLTESRAPVADVD